MTGPTTPAHGIRHGVTILPELPWRESARMWSTAEEMGFAHAWTYDHLVWAGLPDASWFAAVPTLAAAAGVTSTIRLGTFVSSPNYRHPYTFARDVLTLDDISGGRFLCGLGTGGDVDARILGEERTLKERVDRFHEFVPLLDRLLREDRVDHVGSWYTARGARSIRLAATVGDGWITYGGKGETLDEWFGHVAELRARFDDALAAAGRGPLDRYLSLDASPRFSLESVGVYTELTGRAGELGFTDVITHWPRPEGPYAGDVAVLEAVAADVLHRPSP